MLIPVALILGTCWNNLDLAIQRSRQKRTMANMRDAAHAYEEGQPLRAMRDGWGTPIRTHVKGNRYSIISAGSDRIFEMKNPQGQVRGLERDLIFMDGNFVQMPEGL